MQLKRYNFIVLNRRNVLSLWLIAKILIHLFSYSNGCRGNTCSECITSGEGCAWCSDRNFTFQRLEDSRCGSVTELESKNCSKIENPKTTEDISKRKDNNVTDGVSGNGTDAIQLQPQKMHIKIRPKEKGYTFTVTFRPANNFPVDLYFLFDVSFTMRSYIDDLGKLAADIAKDIGLISTNYRMGFGTFQDKVILPFTNTHPAALKNPCTIPNCTEAFSFRHELELTKDLSSFTNTVQRARFTGNIDTPEGGFDALMQIIECSSVGWRENSRQLIIFASDARMHFAGDGKLAGLIKPNDGKCHIVNRTNAMSEKQDYPSIGQISHALDQSKKFVIFAISNSETYLDYLQINRSIPRSTVEKLALSGRSESSILDIVGKKYREMTEGVRLESSTSSENVKVSIVANHPNATQNSPVKVNIGEVVTFNVTVRVDSCPPDPKDRLQTVTISPSDFLKDMLNITVEIICDCDCQKTDSSSAPAEECHHGNGSLVCGICSCFNNRLGEKCECSSSGLSDTSVSDANCIDPRANNKTSLKCSGFGKCKCGVCYCDHQRSGRFCECNDAFCPTNRNGVVCSGNGACKCERCECKQNFTGDACECPIGNNNCLASSVAEGGTQEDKVCSGHGNCTCGECVCEEGYTGRHCQICYQCGNSVCEVSNYDQCATCHVLPEQYRCPDDCPPVETVQEVYINEDTTSGQENCKSWRSEDCHVRYVVRNPGVNATILVERSQVCTEGPDLLIIVLGVVGGVVGVGLILLFLVKLLTTLFDRLEYQHFLKELQSPKWAKQNNPIYVKATTTYHNPVLNKD